MRNLKFALRTVFAGITLSAVVAAAPAVADADLGVTFATATAITYGGTKAYKATITNNGPSHASGIVVDATIPAGLDLVSVAGCTPTVAAQALGEAFPCTVDGILVDTFSADVTITLRLALPDPLPTTCGVTATYGDLSVTVTSDTVDPDATNNTASITPVDVPLVFADLEAGFTGPATAAEGQSVDYTVTVTNHGPCPSVGVRVFSDAIYSVTFVSTTAACATTDADPDTEAVGCLIGDLAVGQTVTFTKTYTINAMPTDLLSTPNLNGISLGRGTGASGTRSALTTRDLDLSNNSAGTTTISTQSATGCSSSGGGGPLGLLVVAAGLVMAFRRRRSA